MPWEALCRRRLRYGPVTTDPIMGEAPVLSHPTLRVELWQIYG
jgi:hypothetical protein